MVPLPVLSHMEDGPGEVRAVIAGETGRTVNEKVFAEVELADGSAATVWVRAFGALEIGVLESLMRPDEMCGETEANLK